MLSLYMELLIPTCMFVDSLNAATQNLLIVLLVIFRKELTIINAFKSKKTGSPGWSNTIHLTHLSYISMVLLYLGSILGVAQAIHFVTSIS